MLQRLSGIGPHEMQLGDEAYAITGCKALVVLHSSLKSELERPTVVGLCFVDRWMYGRTTQGKVLWKTMQIS